MKYGVFVKQTGEGCDYTIGCGQTLIILKSETLEEAALEARREIVDRTDYSGPGRQTFEKAFLVVVTEDLSNFCDIALKQKEEDHKNEVKRKKLAEIERLKREVDEI